MKSRIATLVALLVVMAMFTAQAQAFSRGQIHYMHRIVAPYTYKLYRMAQCESGTRWYINTGNGFYGGLQFTLSTWWSMGGYGYPHHASRLEQMYRAVKLIHRAGYGQWPVCGYR
jgi:hypothetical protein